MRIHLLSRYIISQLTTMTIYTLIALLCLFTLLDIIAELPSVGTQNYHLTQMFLYVLMKLPEKIYELFPLAVLVGSTFSLSQLVARSELTVMKSYGFSTYQLIRLLLFWGLALGLLIFAVGEWVVPPSSSYAEQFKLQATKKEINVSKQGSIWQRQPNSYIYIDAITPDNQLSGVTIYYYNDKLSITKIVHAQHASFYQPDNSWLLKNTHTALINTNHIDYQTKNEHIESIVLDHNILQSILYQPQNMSLFQLYTYISYLKNNHQQTQPYQIIWWKKLTFPITIITMVLLTIAMTPTHARQVNLGSKLFISICVGLIFNLINQLSLSISQIFSVAPIIAALSPILIFSLVALIFIHINR